MIQSLAFLSALGSGLVAGTFFAFSSFVMRALGKLPAHEGIAAMQSINVAVINPVFLGAFVGTAVIGAASAVNAVLRWHQHGSGWLLAGDLLYVVGTFGVTVFGNVPMNNRLATLSPATPEAAMYWAHYLARWTTWNTVRTVAATAAMAAFVIAMHP